MSPPTRSAIVAEARAWIGTPYRHQASLKGVGCDCLGLVRGVWRAVYGAEPEADAGLFARLGGGVRKVKRLRAAACAAHDRESPLSNFVPGDVLLFRWRAGFVAKHAAIVTAPDRMVHAHDGAAVAEVAHHALVAARRLCVRFPLSWSDPD